MNIKHVVVISVLLCIAFCQSCKKGCTNPTAYNYVRSAKVDDGSCLYCDSTLQAGNTSNIGVTDNNSSSQFFEQTVVELFVTSNFVQYNGNGCALRGHTNTSSSDTVSTYYTAIVQNETGFTVTYSGTIDVEVFSGTDPVYVFSVSNLSIPPNGSATVNLGSGGQQLEFSGFELFTSSATFSYH